MSSRRARSRTLVALPLLVACLGSGPCSMFPGGALDGPVAPLPADWSALGEGTQCDLEVARPDPKSVYVDCYSFAEQLYVHSHRFARTPRWWGEAWVTTAERTPDVRLRHDGAIYELRAERVDDEALRGRVLRARGFDPVPEGIVLFALRPR